MAKSPGFYAVDIALFGPGAAIDSEFDGSKAPSDDPDSSGQILSKNGIRR